MAFHFDARGDSSDDEVGGIDLNSWKAGVEPAPKASRGGPAPVARMVASVDDDEDESSATPDISALQKSSKRKPTSTPRTRPPAVPSFQAINQSMVEDDEDELTIDIPSIGFSGPGLGANHEDEEKDGSEDELISEKLVVHISRNEEDPDDFEDLAAGDDRVRRVLREMRNRYGHMEYKVLFDDFHVENISFEELLASDNGQQALRDFDPDAEEKTTLQQPSQAKRGTRQEPAKMSSTRPGRGVRRNEGYVSTLDNIDGPDADDISEDDFTTARPRRGRRKQDTSRYYEEPDQEDDDDEEDEESEDQLSRPTRTSLRNKAKPAPSRSLRKRPASTSLSDDESDDDDDLLQSDLPETRRRTTKRQRASANDGSDIQVRQSGRATRHTENMAEVEMDDIYRSGSEDRVPAKPKVTVTREVFKQLPRHDDFSLRHHKYCDSCGQGTTAGQLIDCQGCSLTYHKSCLGHRTNREHLVTKVGEGDFVLQCRRCIAYPRKKDPTAPDQSKCQECRQPGSSCRPFRPRKTPAQEQKERDDNDGVDPIYPVPEGKINNADSVLFRCTNCFRGFHFQHLPSRSDIMDLDMDVDAEQRFREYSRDWKCKECVEMPAKVTGLIAWRPIAEDSYDPALGYDGLEEDDKAYLVRWEAMSYFRARWMPGPWVWGVTAVTTRKAFAKRDDSQHPKMRTEDAIPEDYLRTDIVLNIRFTSIVDVHTEDIDKARIREVKEALIKYKGLSYEDAVWEAPPGPEDEDRWTDFVMAYNDWVMGRYVRQPKASALKARIEKVRKEDFRNLEKKEQPANMEGGKLMEYQIQGLNWLYYKWFTQKNAILADEMGLGKTIQIIGFLGTLIQDHSCYPFLVVVPNSTCPNWRREIKRWAPSLRVVAYYGSRESRDLAYKHEMYPDGAKDLRCHIVVTSYDTAADENCRKFFRNVPWQGLIVDEGQRLKNDKNLLYSALAAMKAPFKILLTGTPLQNNARELFNLLHFLDDSYNPEELEKEFEDLDQEKITRLHDMIRPFFLRRTKAQVLTFLPPMAQIIVPVSMSFVQKKLYRSILAKNPDLMKAIFSTEAATLKPNERGSLNNILMQLRKCLCHPFVYSKSIEDRNVDHSTSHRNLVDASSKLKLLEVLLPKLQERGHRVLIFSQFLEMLDMVEDFLDGMEMRFQRLDGSMNALTKQKRIDEFNAPDSSLFAFLLSTRAGGVGINLATADTVIILDPDFNPHQDIQALSRAHRIGQQKKVLCFQLVTRASAEERIMQIGRRKLALDHVLIQEMDAEDADQNDLVSVLRHGANELFEDSGDQDILYDNSSVERLLDRSHIEDTKAGQDKSAETQFSFARVWANNHGALEDAEMPEMEESVPDPGVWANILKERERVAAEEANAKAEAFGRGRRARQNNVDYTGDKVPDGAEDMTPIKRKKKTKEGSESDTDFQADDSDPEDDVDNGEDDIDARKKNGKTPKKPASPKSQPSTIAQGKRPKAPKNSKVTPKATPSMSKSRGVTGKNASVSKKKATLSSKKSSEVPRKKPKATAFGSPPASIKTSNGNGKDLQAEAREAIANNASASREKLDSLVAAAALGQSLPDVPAEVPSFRRAIVPRPPSARQESNGPPANTITDGNDTGNGTPQASGSANHLASTGLSCRACNTFHPVGSCPLKLAGVEHCNLCGIAHYGHARVCPHIQSETQVRAMLQALKESTEPEHLVNEARRYLRGLKGNLVQMKKQREQKQHAEREAYAAQALQQSTMGGQWW